MSDENLADQENKSLGTGSALTKHFMTIIYPFEKYEILVKLTLDGRFVGIEEIRINKDFRSFRQSKPQKIFREIDRYEPK